MTHVIRDGAWAASQALRERLRALERPPLRAPPFLVVCAVAGVRIGVDLQLTREVLPLVATSPLPEAPPWVLGLVRVGERSIAVIDFAARMSGEARVAALDESVLVVSADDRELGLVVERVEGVERPASDILVEPPVGDLARWMLGVVQMGTAPVLWLEPAALLGDVAEPASRDAG